MSHDPDYAHHRGLLVICHAVANTCCVQYMVNICTKFEVSIFNSSKDRGAPKFQNGSHEPSHATFTCKFFIYKVYI